MDKDKLFDKVMANWPLHITLFVVVMICEAINTIIIKTPVGNMLLLPMLFAMLIGLLLYLAKAVTWIGDEQSHLASNFVIIAIAPFLAKVAVTTGTQLPQVIAAGPALILQEFGNLGTIIVALPFALLLGFKREAVGMTHSIAREPNVGLIASKYGLDSPEGRGVMTTYIVGTLLGTIFIGLFAGLVGSTGILHPYALAMACGVGSGSMMAASSAALTTAFPDMAEQITAFAGTSNVLSNADGIVMTVFIGLPMCNWLYNKLEPVLGKGKHI